MKTAVYYLEDQAAWKVANALEQLLEEKRKKHQPIIILCIGTDRSTGDSLGPLVGSFLL